MDDISNKIKINNKIYPYLQGFSDDLLFWASINTIFLTTVKHFSPSQISLLSAVSIFVSILTQNIIFKIIKKIGNINSVRLGLIILFISSITITLGNSFSIIAIGLTLYHLSFFFKDMNTVILKRNLKYLNKDNLFVELQSKSSMIYALSTMIISFVAGFIFNINNYLPMILCSAICLINIICSSLLYEHETPKESIDKNKSSFKWTRIIFFIILLYGLLYGNLETAQENGKIFIQFSLQKFTSINQTSICLSIILAFSRISRVLSNIIFAKVYKSMKSKLIIALNIILILAIFLLIAGNMIPLNTVGIIVMALGFCMLLFARDPIMNFLKIELLNNCPKENQQKAMLDFNLSRKIVRCIFATLVSLLLLKMDIIYVMACLLVIALLSVLLVFKLYRLLKNN